MSIISYHSYFDILYLGLKKKTKKNVNNSNANPATTAIGWKFFSEAPISDDDKSIFSSSLLLASHKLADNYFNRYKDLIGKNSIQLF